MDQKGFAEREERAKKAEAFAESYFQRHHYRYQATGMESLYPKLTRQAVRGALRTGSFPALSYVRFAPDFRVTTTTEAGSKTTWVEVKATRNVERAAYEHYLRLAQTDPVYLFLGSDCQTFLYAIKLQDVIWEQNNWVTNGSGSGLPFKTVDVTVSKHQKIAIGRDES